MMQMFAPPTVYLRPHQDEAVTALATCNAQFAYAEMCVASGKSLTMAALAARALLNTRVLIVAHTEELVSQNVIACRQMGLTPGICCASLGENATLTHLTVGTVGTIVNRIADFRNVGLVEVDEVHRARMEPYKDNTRSLYLQIKDALPNAWFRGFTGTGWREDGTGSLENSFGDKVYTYGFAKALEDNFVKPLRAVAADVPEFDTAGLKTNAEGEWTGKELSNRGIALAPYHVPAFLEAMKTEGRSRALVFACDIDHAHVLEAMCRTKYGVDARAVTTARDREFRRKAVEDFRQGRYPVLISVMMFNVGFDVPDIDFMALCRPMKSGLLYAQSLGRGARLSDYADDCVVVDFGGNITRHGALDMLEPPERRGPVMSTDDDGTEPEKLPELDNRNVGADLRTKAHAGVLIAAAQKPQWVAVTGRPTFISTRRFWVLQTEIGDAKWFSPYMPPNIHHAYVQHGRFGWTAAGLLDTGGNLHRT